MAEAARASAVAAVPGEPILACRRLSVKAGKRWLLRSIELQVPARAAVGILGPSGVGKSTLLKCLNRLIDLIVTRDLRSVFVETSVADKNVKALVEGAAARDKPVTIGGALFSDAMGAPGTYEGTYIGMIDHNVTTITRALGGDAPPGGLHGNLVGGTP